MASNPIRISPLDLKPSIGIGVSIPFNGPAGGFNTTYTTADQLKSNMINFFLTNFGERVMNPNFGGNLRAQLFEQLTEGSIGTVKKSIENSIRTQFPNVIIKEVKVQGTPDTNDIYISIKYAVSETNIDDSIVINFA
jgi:phage baseplate assembly protein W